MKRDIKRLQSETFDLLVIGGGIMGLAAVREAALGGLAAALIDKGDIGSGTSANSLKLIHGGLRYLQHGDIGRLRQSVRERRAFLRLAPHLVHPLPFLVPTYGHGFKSRQAMQAAFILYNLLAWDRNKNIESDKHIPGGRVISAGECLDLFPGFKKENLTGGAVFHDGQVYSTERLSLAMAVGASEAGCVVANYVEAEKFVIGGRRVKSVAARDALSGEKFEISAKQVINAAGPWADSLLATAPLKLSPSGYFPAKAVNIIVPRLLCPSHAVGIECPSEASDSLVKRGGRLFFITPWRGVSIIGTTYHPYRGRHDDLAMTESDAAELVDSINRAWPQASLRLDEVSFYHVGLVPVTAAAEPAGSHLAKADRVIDHSSDGIDNLISLIGVKYTTARDVAKEAVGGVHRKLGRAVPDFDSAEKPLPGGDIESMADLLRRARDAAPPELDSGMLTHLVHLYGTEYKDILEYGRQDPAWLKAVDGSGCILRAQVLHAIRREMAMTLADCVMRRTDAGAFGHPGRECLLQCADIMGRELAWTEERRRREYLGVEALFSLAPKTEGKEPSA